MIVAFTRISERLDTTQKLIVLVPFCVGMLFVLVSMWRDRP